MFAEDSVGDPVEGVADLHAVQAVPAGEAQPANVQAMSHPRSAPARQSGGSKLRCAATTRAGKPCTNRPMGNSSFCMTHTDDASVKAMVLAARVKGGHTPRVRVGLDLAKMESSLDLSTRDGVVALMEAVAGAVARNAITGTQGQVLVGVAKVALQAIADNDSEAIKALQSRLDQLVMEAPRGRR